MRWRIRRIVNGCAAQQMVARIDVIPQFILYGPVIRAIIGKVCLRQVERCIPAGTASLRGFIQAFRVNIILIL